MREILFRGKSTKSGKWILGNVLKADGGVFVIQNYAPLEGIGRYEVVPETVCQYTGLTDKNGRKIFEGDIVRMPYNNIGDDICEVVYQHDRFLGILADGCEDSIHRNKEIEVIGNIFDNPELIESEATP